MSRRASATPWQRVRPWAYGAIVLGLLAVWILPGAHIEIRPAKDSPFADDLVLRGLDGERLAIEQLRGRIVLINLWASWCGPCRIEIPALDRIARTHAHAGVRVIGVNAEDVTLAELGTMVEELGISYRVAVVEGDLPPGFRTEGVLPHTWIVDRSGRVRVSHAGAASYRAFDRAVTTLVEEP
jgi:thiol-disulfide isomerase/thioredoxin